jgi:hypothetical protein
VNDVYYSSQYASSTGAYNLPVAPGNVTLWVYDPSLRYAPGWRTATTVTANHAIAAITTVGSASVTGLTIRTPDAVLLTTTTVWAPAPGANSSAGATVEAFAYGAAASFDVDAGGGMYRYMPLLKGTYRLWVDSDNTAYDLTDGWYTNAGGLTPDVSAAALKSITASTSLSITIPTGQVLSGAVRDKDGYPVTGIDVQLFANGSLYLDVVSGYGGTFAFVPPPGTYRIAFVDLYGQYRTGWLGASGFVTSYAYARNVTMTSSVRLEGITVDLPMDTPPNPPTNVAATPYHTSAAVTFTGSVGSISRPIIHYAVTANPGGRQCITVNTGTCVVTGLTNGTPYTFTVTASSIVGSSGPSSATAPVIPTPVPDAPGNAAATRSGSTVNVTWTTAVANGSPVTHYQATLSPGGLTCAPTPGTGTGCAIPAVPDGRYTVSVRATNAVGTGPGVTVPITVDTVAPTVTAPTTSLRSGLSMSGGNIPVSVTWGASDALTGVADTTLELAHGAGAYGYQAIGPVTATSMQRVLGSSSSAYRFRDRAVDASGNLSGWATGPAMWLNLRQETGTGIVYRGTWATASSASALGGKARYTSSKGASVTYTFTGRGVSFISRKGTNSGRAAVYIDGVLVANLDLRASATTMRWIAYARMLSVSRTHVLKIVNLATPGRPRLYVDGFATIR